MTIHWCGTGLSAIPGLRALIEDGLDVKVWNRTASKAQEAVGDLTNNIAAYDIGVLGNELSAGDVLFPCCPGITTFRLQNAPLQIAHISSVRPTSRRKCVIWIRPPKTQAFVWSMKLGWTPALIT